jgi:thiol-disulfide isomerase/thioredoxin
VVPHGYQSEEGYIRTTKGVPEPSWTARVLFVPSQGPGFHSLWSSPPTLTINGRWGCSPWLRLLSKQSNALADNTWWLQDQIYTIIRTRFGSENILRRLDPTTWITHLTSPPNVALGTQRRQSSSMKLWNTCGGSCKSNGIKKIRSHQVNSQPSSPKLYRETLNTHRALSTLPSDIASVIQTQWYRHYMVVTDINSLEEFNEIVGLFSPVLSEWLFLKTRRKIKGPSTVVVEFWAGWCSSSRKINPIFDKWSERLQYDGLGFFRVDVDDQPLIRQAVKVQKVATNLLCFFFNSWTLGTILIVDTGFF